MEDERVEPRVGDGLALPVTDSAADYVVSGLVLNFIPAPAAALAEMAPGGGPGGTIAAYVWDYADGMQMLRAFWDAAVSLDPGAADLDEGVRFPLCRPDRLRRLFSRAGLADVEDREIVVPTVFDSFADFWTPFLSGQGPAPGYCATLPPAALERLRARLSTMLAPMRRPSHPPDGPGVGDPGAPARAEPQPRSRTLPPRWGSRMVSLPSRGTSVGQRGEV